MSKGKTTFLDLPLEKRLYKCRPAVLEKKSIRILITDAGHKFAYCLIYKICTGQVFGDDQEVYIHLVNAKGVIDHKSIFLELEECGFHLLRGWVVTSDVEEAYRNVDVVVLTTNFEEQSGFTHKETLAGQIIKARQMIYNIAMHCKPSVKVVLVGPSSKFILTELYLLNLLEPKIPASNMSAVTLLDEAIAKAHLAARLKTTTNKIKNVVIWGMTCPDVHNATVRTFPKNDLGALEEEEIPVREALEDDRYLQNEFVQCIFRRKIGPEFSKSGKSMAIATARHLKALFQGVPDAEIISMGVITPASEPYMIPQGLPFSFPVRVTGNGSWEVREDVKYDVQTHLNLMGTVHRFFSDKPMLYLTKAVEFIQNYEEKENEIINLNLRQEVAEKILISEWDVKYFLSMLPSEAIPRTNREGIKKRKSITWEDSRAPPKDEFGRISSIRFCPAGSKQPTKVASILKQMRPEGEVLPPIRKSSHI